MALGAKEGPGRAWHGPSRGRGEASCLSRLEALPLLRATRWRDWSVEVAQQWLAFAEHLRMEGLGLQRTAIGGPAPEICVSLQLIHCSATLAGSDGTCYVCRPALARLAPTHDTSLFNGALCHRRVSPPALSPPTPPAAQAPWSRFNVSTTKDVDVLEAKKSVSLAQTADFTGGRRAIIYRSGQHGMTSGVQAARWWSIRFDRVDKWSNPLMGWISSADTMSQISMHMKFDSAEAAILCAIRNGWAFEVAPGQTTELQKGNVDNQYSYNFLSREVQHKMKALGVRKSRHVFANPEGRRDAWVNYRRTQFGAEPWKPASYQTTAAWTGEAWPAKKPVDGAAEH